jgi:flagellar basal-body rod protein FlgG
VSPFALEDVAGSALNMDILSQYLETLATKIETLQGNIANAETPAYKRVRVDMLPLAGRYSPMGIGTQDATGAAVPAGRAGAGVRVVGTTRDFRQGKLIGTNRCLDVAIEGAGFFQVRLPDGREGYTRDGRLNVNSHGRLVTRTGYVLQPEITLPQDVLDVSIGPDGQVIGRQAGTPNATSIFGQINLFRFVCPDGLLPDAGGLFGESAAAGRPVQVTPGDQGTGVLRQCFLEGSNVNLAAELSRLVVASNQYHAIFLAIQRATSVGR